MSDELQEGQEPTTQEEIAETPPAQEVARPAIEPSQSIGELPDWAQGVIKDLRSENAKHRQAKKQAEKDAETQARQAAEEQGRYKELYEKLQGQLSEVEQKAQALELARLRDGVARKHNLPGPLADRLRGDTEEEIEADALALLEAMPKSSPPNTTTDAANGVGNTTPTQTISEVELQEMAAVYGVTVDGLKKSLNII